MPTYEYACTACGHAFERFESIIAKPNKSCEKCKKKKAERKISGGGGFLFKGTGFYITDYKKGAAPAAAAKSDGESGKADSNGPGKTAKTETAKTETAKTETAKSETAKSETAKTETKASPSKKSA